MTKIHITALLPSSTIRHALGVALLLAATLPANAASDLVPDDFSPAPRSGRRPCVQYDA